MDRLFAYWRENPPVHELVAFMAGAFGYKPASKPQPAVAPTPRSAGDPSGIGAMILRFPNGAVKAG